MEKMRMENEDMAVTPRWPMRLGEKSRKWRVEVRTTAEARRLIEKKTIRIGGKDAEVVPWVEQPRAQTKGPEGAPRAPKAMITRTEAPMQGIGSFAAVASTGRAGHTQGEGWTTVRGAKNVGGTCRKCARTGHLERACPLRQKTSQFSCHGCGKFGHFIKACPARGTSIFAPRGCFNCGKRDHQDDQCSSPKKDTRGEKREGGAVVHPKPKKLDMRERHVDPTAYSPVGPGRLGETSGPTVASESSTKGTSAAPLLVLRSGPAGARNP